jgi:hypothetical protein
MASVDRKWLPPILIVLAGLASAGIYLRLPALVDLEFERVLPFAVAHSAQPAPRWVALFLVPAVTLLLWAAFRLAPTAAGQRLGRRLFRRAPEEVTSPAQFERFGKTYDAIVLGVVVLLLGLHGAILAAAFQAPDLAARIVSAVLGASLLLMGNVMPRLRPNWVAGLRTTRILSDPELWRSTHRSFGRALVVSGLLTLVAAVLAPKFGLLVGLASLLASLFVGFMASRRQGGTPSGGDAASARAR